MSPRKSANEGQKTVQGKNQKGSTGTRRRDSDDERGGNYSAQGGSRSGRAALSGATGERSTSGGRNKPEPKNQDAKAQFGPRNRARRKPN